MRDVWSYLGDPYCTALAVDDRMLRGGHPREHCVVTVDLSYSPTKAAATAAADADSSAGGRRYGATGVGLSPGNPAAGSRADRLRKIPGGLLAPYINVRQLYLAGNLLMRIEGLDKLKKVTELDLARNCLRELDGIWHMALLKRLDVSGNQLSHIPRNIERLLELEEFICAGNEVRSLREVDKLKPLAKLTVVDLTLNPIHTTKRYREYAVFNLPQLQELDREAVDMPTRYNAELAFSPEHASGRIGGGAAAGDAGSGATGAAAAAAAAAGRGVGAGGTGGSTAGAEAAEAATGSLTAAEAEKRLREQETMKRQKEENARLQRTLEIKSQLLDSTLQEYTSTAHELSRLEQELEFLKIDEPQRMSGRGSEISSAALQDGDAQQTADGGGQARAPTISQPPLASHGSAADTQGGAGPATLGPDNTFVSEIAHNSSSSLIHHEGTLGVVSEVPAAPGSHSATQGVDAAIARKAYLENFATAGKHAAQGAGFARDKSMEAARLGAVVDMTVPALPESWLHTPQLEERLQQIQAGSPIPPGTSNRVDVRAPASKLHQQPLTVSTTAPSAVAASDQAVVADTPQQIHHRDRVAAEESSGVAGLSPAVQAAEQVSQPLPTWATETHGLAGNANVPPVPYPPVASPGRSSEQRAAASRVAESADLLVSPAAPATPIAASAPAAAATAPAAALSRPSPGSRSTPKQPSPSPRAVPPSAQQQQEPESQGGELPDSKRARSMATGTSTASSAWADTVPAFDTSPEPRAQTAIEAAIARDEERRYQSGWWASDEGRDSRLQVLRTLQQRETHIVKRQSVLRERLTWTRSQLDALHIAMENLAAQEQSVMEEMGLSVAARADLELVELKQRTLQGMQKEKLFLQQEDARLASRCEALRELLGVKTQELRNSEAVVAASSPPKSRGTIAGAARGSATDGALAEQHPARSLDVNLVMATRDELVRVMSDIQLAESEHSEVRARLQSLIYEMDKVQETLENAKRALAMEKTAAPKGGRQAKSSQTVTDTLNRSAPMPWDPAPKPGETRVLTVSAAFESGLDDVQVARVLGLSPPDAGEQDSAASRSGSGAVGAVDRPQTGISTRFRSSGPLDIPLARILEEQGRVTRSLGELGETFLPRIQARLFCAFRFERAEKEKLDTLLSQLKELATDLESIVTKKVRLEIEFRREEAEVRNQQLLSTQQALLHKEHIIRTQEERIKQQSVQLRKQQLDTDGAPQFAPSAEAAAEHWAAGRSEHESQSPPHEMENSAGSGDGPANAAAGGRRRGRGRSPSRKAGAAADRVSNGLDTANASPQQLMELIREQQHDIERLKAQQQPGSHRQARSGRRGSRDRSASPSPGRNGTARRGSASGDDLVADLARARARSRSESRSRSRSRSRPAYGGGRQDDVSVGDVDAREEDALSLSGVENKASSRERLASGMRGSRSVSSRSGSSAPPKSWSESRSRQAKDAERRGGSYMSRHSSPRSSRRKRTGRESPASTAMHAGRSVSPSDMSASRSRASSASPHRHHPLHRRGSGTGFDSSAGAHMNGRTPPHSAHSGTSVVAGRGSAHRRTPRTASARRRPGNGDSAGAGRSDGAPPALAIQDPEELRAKLHTARQRLREVRTTETVDEPTGIAIDERGWSTANLRAVVIGARHLPVMKRIAKRTDAFVSVQVFPSNPELQEYVETPVLSARKKRLRRGSGAGGVGGSSSGAALDTVSVGSQMAEFFPDDEVFSAVPVRQRTDTKPDTLFPVWNQEVLFEHMTTLRGLVRFTIMDSASSGMDDFVAYADVPFDDLLDQRVHTVWLPLHRGGGGGGGVGAALGGSGGAATGAADRHTTPTGSGREPGGTRSTPGTTGRAAGPYTQIVLSPECALQVRLKLSYSRTSRLRTIIADLKHNLQWLKRQNALHGADDDSDEDDSESDFDEEDEEEDGSEADLGGPVDYDDGDSSRRRHSRGSRSVPRGGADRTAAPRRRSNHQGGMGYGEQYSRSRTSGALSSSKPRVPFRDAVPSAVRRNVVSGSPSSIVRRAADARDFRS